MRYVSPTLKQEVENCITSFEHSIISGVLRDELFVIKFVPSIWAAHYRNLRPLKISETPALTWGTATYVTPIQFPLSSVLYGRVGLVCPFDPRGWKIFDATGAPGRSAYRKWVRSQPAYSDLLLTVHSTHANHILRNRFREAFRIDCVLFRPDQEAEGHTDVQSDFWMAVTDWSSNGHIESSLSTRLNKARFTVLVDEEFDLQGNSLPIRRALRKIEPATQHLRPHTGDPISHSLKDLAFPGTIINSYHNGGYVHAYIEP